MAANAGPDIIEDGIVFYYDTGNTVKSFIGEPTENLFGTTAMAFQSDYPDFTSYIQNGSDSIGNYIIKDTVNAPWYTGLRVRDNGVRPLTTGVPYVVSFECQSPQHGWSWSLDSNQYGGDWDGNDSGRTSFTNLTFISTGGTTYTQDMVNTWQKVQYVVYMKSWSGGSPTAYPLDSFFPDANNIKIYYRNPQMEVSKTHATQYTPTSRSVTQGLLDMARNSTVNLTDVSFNSTAQITFDGTNDYINVPYNSTQNLTNQGTVSVWIYPFLTTQGSFAGLVAQCTGGSVNTQAYQLSWRQISGAMYGAICNGSGTYNEIYGTLPTVANTWYNIVFTWNGSQLNMYNNGTLIGTTTQTINNQVLTTDLTIGGYTYKGAGGAGEYFNGKIANVEIYNRGLTASEVLTNYNALKTRFGI